MDDNAENEEPGKLGEFERMLFEGPPPPPPHLSSIGRELVERATLRFKNLRQDQDRVEDSALKLAKAGEIAIHDAKLLWLDSGDVITHPLVEAYLDEGKFGLVAKYLKYRIMYHPVGWLTERNRMALDRMIEAGEAPLAMTLLREFLKKLFQHTQEQWRAAGRKVSNHAIDTGQVEAHKRAAAKALAELPAHLEIAEQELAEIEAYIVPHGSDADRAAIEDFHAQIAKARKRFDLGGDAAGQA